MQWVIYYNVGVGGPIGNVYDVVSGKIVMKILDFGGVAMRFNKKK